MRKDLATLALALIFSGLLGCAGVGVTATSDPARKLRDATYLQDHEDRPLIAERLIQESVGIYTQSNDKLGLAEAYRSYGLFFQSRAVEGKSSKHYREHGFLDRTATFDTRFEKSIEYLEKSRGIFLDNNRFDAMTNVDLNIGFAYLAMKNVDAGCKAFDQSVADYRENIRRNPDARPILPSGYSSYEQFIDNLKKRQGCA